MIYSLDLVESFTLSDKGTNLRLYSRFVEYYKTRPFVLAFQIILIIAGTFIPQLPSILVGITFLLTLPNWKEKYIR
ncbi:MAG: hypothetical protein COU30_00710 [Candidatus Magasanikbacteria bacterium CG10_big_fil_rev_8_21_14_0_10_38_6]|uniref:Uncharacterized protein n=1 Tax=Candidatus Magasanikbacteria bacterium CG10_big_fil_rev_8_21_14_0_10_38_6 TaxID=1974647 RepID=A0A2M6P1Z5_9BACT|nr:MAG: hypothetical protein COU30_00710 [Candidatus Magasanikbacteria bacterium CG10_big_fil_rev_8_21_14_0_10_38_6]